MRPGPEVGKLSIDMILARSAGGTLCFVIRLAEEESALGLLAASYPGRSIEVVDRRAGLLIACVGTQPSGRHPALSIVGLRLNETEPDRRAALG